MELTQRMLIGLGRALQATTEGGKSAFGWIRLARIRSRVEGKTQTYVLAVRESEKHGMQFGCSCPDWVFRKRHLPGDVLCKHQVLFLSHAKESAPKSGVWLYRAGKAFLEQIQKGSEQS